MFDLKDAEIKDEEAEMILQNRKWCHYVPRLLANLNETPRLLSSIRQASLFADRKNTKDRALIVLTTRIEESTLKKLT